jgi:acetyltransferase-like isoleucine patch superfamily enzyme
MGQFIAENGLYVALARKMEERVESFRNHLLARKLKVRSICVASGCHLRGLSHVRLGENFSAGRGLWLEAVTEYAGQTFSPELLIGDNVSIAFWGHIAATNRVEIGSGVLIGSKVHITDHSHGSYGSEPRSLGASEPRSLGASEPRSLGASEPHSSPHVPPAERLLSSRPVVIGKNVWIGDGVFIGPGSEIGESSIIGTNSVVKGRIPPFTIAVGAPARPIKAFDFKRQEWVRVDDQR